MQRPSKESALHIDDASGCIHVNKLVLAGGGPWTIAFIGAIQYLEHTGMMQSINTLVGCSAGALISFLVCLGLTAADVRRFLTDKFRKDGCHRLDIEQALGFIQTWGLDDGRKINRALQDALNLYADRTDITFVDFAKLTGKDLIVCVSNLTEKRHEFMCMSRTPNMSVLKALRMSMSIPLIFTPVLHDGAVYVDGGIFNNFPADYCLNSDDKSASVVDTLGFNLIFSCQHKNQNQKDRRQSSTEERVMEDDNSDPPERNVGDFMQYVWGLTTAVVSRSNHIVHCIGESPDTEGHVITKNVFTINFNPITSDESLSSETNSMMNFSITEMEFSLPDAYVDACIRYGYSHAKKCLAAAVTLAAQHNALKKENEPDDGLVDLTDFQEDA